MKNMYIKLLLLITITLITACSANATKDTLQLAAEDSYTEASRLISKAWSYNLTVIDAENELSQAAVYIKNKNYDESIISSQHAGDLATNAVNNYQDELTLAKIKAAKHARTR
jgi:hypothetical protein